MGVKGSMNPIAKGTTIEDLLVTPLGAAIKRVFDEEPNPPSIGDDPDHVIVDLGEFGAAVFKHQWDSDDPDRQIRVLIIPGVKTYQGDDLAIEDTHGYGDLGFDGNYTALP